MYIYSQYKRVSVGLLLLSLFFRRFSSWTNAWLARINKKQTKAHIITHEFICMYVCIYMKIQVLNTEISFAWVAYVSQVEDKPQEKSNRRGRSFSRMDKTTNKKKRKRKHHSKWVYVYSLHDISIAYPKVFFFSIH
jgi:hypothetical protein